MSDVVRVRSRGPRDVEDTWRRYVPSARLEQADPRRIAFDWTSVQVGSATVVGYDLTASVHSAVAPDEQLMACRVATASGWVRDDRGDLDVALPWMSTQAGTRAHWDGRAQVRAFVFDRSRAEQVARQISGDDRLVLRVTETAPTSPLAGRQWERAYRYILESLVSISDPQAAPMPLLEAELERHALRSTLSAFRTTFLAATERPAQRRAAPSTVRRALTYMEEKASAALTIDDVAAAAGISTRGLQYAFQRAMGMSPTEYLRELRLVGARDELRSGAAPRVADVARRWGFASPSRFAAHYRRRFGETPAQTLRAL